MQQQGLLRPFALYGYRENIMIKNYFTILKNEFKGYNTSKLGKDLMSGVTVAAVALPLALAFGVGSGASAGAGLITAIISGLIISALSGGSFQISGPTGAMTAVLISIVAKYGLQGVFVVSFIAGAILVVSALLKLGKIVSIIPTPVITGFTSGIAIIIALGQIDNLFGTESVGENTLKKVMSYADLGFPVNISALGIGLLVIGIMIIYPKKWSAKIPSSLVAIIIATIVSSIIKLDIETVGEIPKTLLLQDRFQLSNVNFNEITGLISPAITVAALGMIESLLCGASASRMKEDNFDADQELLAQGIGNMIIPFFGGVPATAAIARSSVAIKSGCQTRLTGIFHAVGLLLSMFLLNGVMSRLPLSALAGVLMVTAWRMNEWGSIKYIFKNKFKSAISQFLITMGCTVIFDLTVAIIIGIAYSMILFVTNNTKLRINTSKVENKKFHTGNTDVEILHKSTIVVYISGQLFFANIDSYKKKIADLKEYDKILLSMRGLAGIDMGACLEFIEVMHHLEKEGKKIYLCGTQDNVQKMLQRADIEYLPNEKFYWSVDKVLAECV